MPSTVSVDDQLLTSPAAAARDFMRTGYEHIREPLNLCDAGQPWFRGIYRRENWRGGLGLVLGATPWLAHLVSRFSKALSVVDMSPVMLELSRDSLACRGAALDRVQFVESNWLDLSRVTTPLRVVVGDNSFNYLPFPDGWNALCDELAARMEPGAQLIARFCSVPHGHRPLPVERLVASFLRHPTLNCTALRAALLFAHLDERTFTIDTERVLDTFEANLDAFGPLFEKFQLPDDNDLVTIRKYRGASARYVAPPLTQILAALGRRFAVTSVHFGPYEMSDHFPLVVATRR